MTKHESARHVRLFYAVELPQDVRASAAAHAASLRAAATQTIRASWEREEKLHITLKFVGEVAPEMTEKLTAAAARAAAAARTFELRLSGAGVFPAPSRPQVLWLGMEDEGGRLSELQRRVEEESVRAGARPDARPFHAHVTVARLRASGRDERELARRHFDLGFAPLGFRVREIVLMRSELGPRGSTYTPVSRHEFKEREQ
jgi:2'-5' RNA ligase